VYVTFLLESVKAVCSIRLTEEKAMKMLLVVSF